MSSADLSRDVAEMFIRAEQSGLKLAIKGRTFTLVVLGAWLVITRADDVVRALGYAGVMAIFVVLGLVHYSLIATLFDQR